MHNRLSGFQALLCLVAFALICVQAQTATLPSGWLSRDIGAVGQPGSAAEASGTFTVSGAGADVWGTADAFHFAYQSRTGDVTITARVTSIQGSNTWTKAT